LRTSPWLRLTQCTRILLVEVDVLESAALVLFNVAMYDDCSCLGLVARAGKEALIGGCGWEPIDYPGIQVEDSATGSE
jgi:hypothetical protein